MNIQVIASALVLLLVLTSCGTAGGPAATLAPVPTVQPPSAVVTPTPGTGAPTAVPPPPNAPRYGGTVTIPDSITLFDPLNNIGYAWGTLGAIGNVYGQFIRTSPTDRATIEGDLAQSWTVSDNGATWKLNLRPDVVDHGGVPFTANDAYWTMVRYTDKPNGVPATRQGCLASYVRKSLDAQGKPLASPGAEITGPNELTIRLVAPRAAFLPCLVSGFTAVVPSRITKPIDTAPGGKYRDFDPDKGEIIGYGPFMVKDVLPQNSANWVRFDKYFRKGLPYLDSVRLIYVPDASTRMAAFRTGRLDALAIGTGESKRNTDELQRALGKDGVVVLPTLGIGFAGLQVNARIPPFGPLEEGKSLRWAVQLTIDRAQVKAGAWANNGVLSTPYQPFPWIYTPDEYVARFPGLNSEPTVKARDIAEAKGIMEKAGYGPGKRLKATYLCGSGGTPTDDACEIISQQLKQIYIDADVISGQSGALTERKRKGDFTFASESKGSGFDDPDGQTLGVYWPEAEGGFGLSGWNPPGSKFRALFEQQTGLQTREARVPILREMAKLIHDDAAAIGVVRANYIFGYRGNWRGFIPWAHDGQGSSFETLWLSR